ncbi:hypothetical protein [Halorussus amylolyticus]|uniref:hypothetical protein n=1 Tax=Halorussus amylolyticus TaxID=1126242 RepID=UPI001048D310|nr:hypothetical protein [Halorussus amylolyticus]
MSRTVNVVSGLYDAVFRPASLVEARTVRERQGSVLNQLRQFRQLVVVYVVNLAAYAGPLTVAGFGRQNVPAMPPWFEGALAGLGTPEAWELLYAFAQNSLFLLAATALTLLSVHVSMVLTLQSSGVLRSAYAVIYSTSAYLAGIFTVVWYLSTTSGVTAARTLVVDLQKTFIYAVIDWFGADLGLPGGRPGSLEFGQLTPHGQSVLAVLAVLVAYYLYSLYLGARINHGASRTDGLLVVIAVALSPVVYIGASILTYTVSTVPVP